MRRLDVNESEVTPVQWQRLHDLVTVAGQFEEAELFRAKKHALNALPYFIAKFKYKDNKYMVAESPVFGNASFIVAEHLVPGDCVEVLELSKAEALALGARRVPHTKNAPNGPQHIRKIRDVIEDMSLTEGLW